MPTIERREDSKGRVRYRAKVRVLGERSRSRTFARLTDAKTWASRAELGMKDGDAVPTAIERRRTLAGLIDAYLAHGIQARRRTENDPKLIAQLDWWRAEAGHVLLEKLKPEVVASYRTKVAKRLTTRGGSARPVTAATVNRYLAALSAVCKWGWKEHRWLKENPVLAVSKGPEHAGMVRYLDDDERKALLAACKASTDPNIYCAVVLALATGARAGNLRNLTWADVDLEQWRLRFVHTKNDQPRYVPIVGSAQAILQAQLAKDPTGRGWVFKGHTDDAPASLDGPWRAVRTAAGLTGDKHVRFHDLRHTSASYLTMAGASLAEVAEALGHRTLVMAKRYSHQSGEHVRSTFERIADRLSK